MTSRKVLILAIVALGVLGLALVLAHRDTASQTKEATALYPDLKKELNQITAVRIFKSGNTQAVEIARKDNQWVVSERAGFPANSSKVNKLLIALADAKAVEEKTSNPASYAALGVEDVKSASATGTRVEVQGSKTPIALIVGKSAGAHGSYVRRAGEPASWLIDQPLDVSTAPGEWLRNTIIDVSADRVQSVTVTTDSAKPYTVEKTARADADFKTTAIPKGKEADTFAVNGFASALSSLNLSDVRAAKEFEAEKPAAHASLKTFDGLVADLEGWNKDGKHFIAVKTSYDDGLAKRFHVETKQPDKGADAKAPEATPAPPAPKPAATDNVAETAKSMNGQLQGWVFEIPDYKYEAIFKPS
ncbi:MAG: DUF4340 domain-containing protein, partial [Povalibacter sp.]